MTTAEWIAAIIGFVFSGIFAILGIFQFAEKGFPLNNTYLWASKEERKIMDKTPVFRQSAIVFWFLSALFLVIALSVVLQNPVVELLEIPLIVSLLIYVIVSSLNNNRHNKK